MTLLQQITDRTSSLYSLPEVALEVLDLTSHPQVDVPALKACIERDPALTCKILKVVNSSLFGLSRRVADLTQALSLLGVKPLKMLVLGFSLPKDLMSDVETLALSRYWRHALIKAVACRELAEHFWDIPGDEPFIAGLLQDIGQLVLLQQLGEPYQDFLQKSYPSPQPLADLEMEALGFDHAIVSARILSKWELPSALVQAVAVPQLADRIDHLPIPDRVLPQILHLGELIAQLLTRRGEGKLEELLGVAQRYKSLNFDSLQDLIHTLEEKVTAFGEVLSLYQPDGPPFCDILTQAHIRLAAVAEDATYDLATTASKLLRETQDLAGELRTAVANRPERIRCNEERLSVSTSRSLADSPHGVGTKTATTKLVPSTRWHPRLTQAIEQGRQQRAPVSLLSVQIDHYENVVFLHGPEQAANLVRLLELTVQGLIADEAQWASAGEACFAAWWIGADRSQAVRAGRQLLQDIEQKIALSSNFGAGRLTLSVGVATLAVPTRNFPTQDLIIATERCGSAAQACGGNCVKSIEV